jgi:hypothetical protein
MERKRTKRALSTKMKILREIIHFFLNLIKRNVLNLKRAKHFPVEIDKSDIIK